MLNTHPQLIYLPMLVALGFAAHIDWTTKRIPNQYIVAAFVAAGLIAAQAVDPAAHGIAFGIVFVATFALWMQNAGLGGGDVKLLSCVALALGWTFVPFLAACAFIAFALTRTRSMLPPAWRRDTNNFPLAAAAAPAFVVALYIGGKLS